MVQKSPSLSSRPESPLEFYDPTRETLLALLKNITEEAGDTAIPSNSSLCATPLGSRQPSPIINRQQPSPVLLTKQLADVLSNQTNVLERKSISYRKSHTPDRRQSSNSISNEKILNNFEVDSQQRSGSLTGTNSKYVQGLEKVCFLPKTELPIIQITKTDSQRLQKSTSQSKESLNSMEGSSSSINSAVGKTRLILIKKGV